MVGVPPLPVTLTEYDPTAVAVNEQFEVSVDPDVRMTLLHEPVRPLAGVNKIEKLTVPVNPLRLATDIVLVPDDPIVKVTIDDVEARLKSFAALTVRGSQRLVTPLLLTSPE
jgi:hypothetical protein